MGSYALIITFDSQIVRNTMIPEQKSSDWLNTIMEENGLWSLWSKLGTYVTDESLSNYYDLYGGFYRYLMSMSAWD